MQEKLPIHLIRRVLLNKKTLITSIAVNDCTTLDWVKLDPSVLVRSLNDTKCVKFCNLRAQV